MYKVYWNGQFLAEFNNLRTCLKCVSRLDNGTYQIIKEDK